MLQQLLNHISQQALFKPTEKILLAVSGGVDSMVMLHLFSSTEFSFGVAHCNYKLRGTDSDADQDLVRQTCDSLGVEFHAQTFDTEVYARSNHLSIQMAARELRYQFFNQLMSGHQYAYVATAHHHNDSIETILLNLVRGTGIEGLTGIPVRNERTVRPLLFATRKQLLRYAKENGVKWREDISNRSDYYDRNLIRNQVIPILEKINLNFEESFRDTLQRLQGAKALAGSALQQFATNAIVVYKFASISIDRELLLSRDFPEVLLWEIVKAYGFNFHQCKEIVKQHQAGKIFNTSSHQLTVDRAHFVIQELKKNEFNESIIQPNELIVHNSGQSLKLQVNSAADFRLTADSVVAQLDADNVDYPITWRRWRKGDKFFPLGMQHQKKISDFLVDSKVCLPEKERISVLESANGEIIWVVGLRISDRVKVTSGTKKILVIEWASLHVF